MKHCDLFQSWTVTRLGPDPDKLVFEMSSAFIGPEFPQVKLPKVTDLTWGGKKDTWLPALYSALGCALLPWSSLLPQLCCLLKWLDKKTQQKTCCGVVVFSLCGLSMRGKKTRGQWQGEKYWGTKNQRGWLGGYQLHGRDGAQQKWLKSQAQSQDLWQLCDICCSWVLSLWAFGGDVSAVAKHSHGSKECVLPLCVVLKTSASEVERGCSSKGYSCLSGIFLSERNLNHYEWHKPKPGFLQ